MAVTIFRNLPEAKAKLRLLGYTKCEGHPREHGECWLNAEKQSHILVSKRGARVHFEPLED